MINYVNILRSLAIIGVLFIHISAPMLLTLDNMSYWWIGNIFDGGARWSVPIFFMISGMLLLNPKKEESLTFFLKKRLSKILLPFIFWSIFYTVWKHRDALQDLSIPAAIKDIINGDVYYHLWFLYAIIGVYLIVPLIRIVIANSDRAILKYYLIIWFISSSIFKMLSYYTAIDVRIELQPFTGYLGYFILGYYLHEIELTKRNRVFIYISAVLSLAITVIGTYIGTQYIGSFEGIFYEYLLFNTIFVSVGIFIFIKQIDWDSLFSETGFFMRVMTVISTLSFGIYLIHPFVINLISSKLDYEFIHPIIGIPITVITVLLISCLFVWIMKRIPVVKKLVP